MQPTPFLRILLVLGGLIAIAIGASILFTPEQFHAGYGIDHGSDPNALSEVRAPGGALLALGAMMLIGVFVKSFTLASTSIAAAVYLAYGVARLVSIGLDGMPEASILGAAGIELALGAACAAFLVRSVRRPVRQFRGVNRGVNRNVQRLAAGEVV